MSQPGFDFENHAPFDPSALTVAPSEHVQARETSALAAVQVQPKRGRQNAELMVLLTAAGEVGLSDPEIQQRTGWLRSSICARRGDCKSQLEPAPTRYVEHGQSYCRWRVKA